MSKYTLDKPEEIDLGEKSLKSTKALDTTKECLKRAKPLDVTKIPLKRSNPPKRISKKKECICPKEDEFFYENENERNAWEYIFIKALTGMKEYDSTVIIEQVRKTFNNYSDMVNNIKNGRLYGRILKSKDKYKESCNSPDQLEQKAFASTRKILLKAMQHI